MAECHPVGFQWVMEAKERGAKVIHVDPRFTRTSAMADLHVPIRAGQRHRLPRRHRQLHPRERAASSASTSQAYTNAAHDRHRGLRGHRGPRRPVLRLGPETALLRHRRPGSTRGWRCSASAGEREDGAVDGEQAHGAHGGELHRGEPPDDRPDPRAPALRLPAPQAPLQPLHAGDGRARSAASPRRPSSRSPRRSARTPGASAPSAFCYAVGWTQHTVGVQYIRTAAIIQLLLGNIGRPGGGILALRGHASIQGSTDIPTLYNILPGLPADAARRTRITTPRRLTSSETRRRAGFWGNMRRLHGQPAQGLVGRRGHRGERLLLRLPAADHRRPLAPTATVIDMLDGKVKGFFVLGENPAVGSANAQAAPARAGEARLAGGARLPGDRDAPPSGTTRPRSRPASCAPRRSAPRSSSCRPPPTPRRTAASPTPSGCCSGTTRRSSRRGTAARSCGSCTTSAARIREKLAGSDDPRDRPILDLTWDYPTDGRARGARAPRRCCGRSAAATAERRAARRLHRR